MALVTGWTVPVTADRWSPVLKSALSVTSLLEAKITLPGGGGVGVGVGLGLGVGVGVGVGVPVVHATPVNHGSPEPAGPALPAMVGSAFMFQNCAVKFRPFLLALFPPLQLVVAVLQYARLGLHAGAHRSEEHTSELQSR